MKKIRVSSELTYILAIIILSFSVAMVAASNFGVSMIVAPAYILSQKISFLTFGQCEYILQASLFIVLCILMKKVKIVYLSSFITCIFYGAVLDLWRKIIPAFNPDVTAPGSFPMWERIIFFSFGMLLTSLAVSLFFKTYLYPQVYDFFVKIISAKFNIDRTKFKICFDISCLIIGCIMTLSLFGKFVGIGIGTLIMTAFNGMIIGFFDRLTDNYIEFKPSIKKLYKFFN